MPTSAVDPTVFKARPVNKAILESAGDLGVPVVRKKPTTVVKEFALTSARSSKKVEPSWKVTPSRSGIT